jgi:hypothetical protein
MLKYPDTKAAVGAMGVPCRSALQTIPAYNKVIEAALGNIIPTIMMAHITNMNTKSASVHGCNSIMDTGAPASIAGILDQR